MGGARELLCAYARACTNVSIVQKNSWKKFSPMACIGENFLPAKISAYTVLIIIKSNFYGKYVC